MWKNQVKEATHTIEEKLSIVLEGLKEQSNVSKICRKYGISQSLYYKWRDKFFEGGKKHWTAPKTDSQIKPERLKLRSLKK